jgi:uncharacterized membrane protein
MTDISVNKKRKGQRGSILALSAVAMLSILLAAGLGVDISRFYLAKNELRMQLTPQLSLRLQL